MPIAVAVSLAHAAVQVIANAEGIRLLHIKGPAVDERLLDITDASEDGRLRPVPRRSTDADVWVSPAEVNRLISAMQSHQWAMTYGFEDDSAFGHAATMTHLHLGHVDVHRVFPGVGLDPQKAFDLLWAERTSSAIAHYPCWVPSLVAQRLVLLLHAARAGAPATHPDIKRTWTDAGQTDRDAVLELARALRAEVALAAATGRLEAYRRHREHDLWQLLSSGRRHSLSALMVARVRAAPNRREAMRTALRLLLPKSQRLRVSLGRKPTSRELAVAYLKRVRVARRELRQLLVGSGR